jgi:hypothetical protein
MEAGMAKTSKINDYRVGAARCEQRAKKARTQDAREWQMILARAYQVLAEGEAEPRALEIRTNKAAA